MRNNFWYKYVPNIAWGMFIPKIIHYVSEIKFNWVPCVLADNTLRTQNFTVRSLATPNSEI